MLFKRTLFAAFVTFSLLAICLHASPIRRAPVGTKATVTLSKLDGTITFVQTTDSDVTVSGQLNQGIVENNPDNYFVTISVVQASFSQLGINIKVPGTDAFSATGPGDLDQIVGLNLSISHGEEVIDQGTITKS